MGGRLFEPASSLFGARIGPGPRPSRNGRERRAGADGGKVGGGRVTAWGNDR